MAKILNFTKAALEAIKPADKRQFFQDTREPELHLYVTQTGAKTFYAQLYINGQTIRHPVGHFPALSIPLARKKAKAVAGQVAEGKDPRAEKSREKVLKKTLEQVLADYLRNKDLKPGTQKDYKRAIEENYGDWLKKPFASITGRMIQNRYVTRGKFSQARTDNGFRVLRALFNYAKAAYREESGGVFAENPTDIVSEAKIRFKPKRKRRKVNDEDLAAWWIAVHKLSNEISRDFLVFLLLTGVRSRTEAACLRWENIDFRRRVFQLMDTKNREDTELPLPHYAAELLLRRKGKKTKGWVFPAPTGKTGYLSDPRASIDNVKAESGVLFSPHDLRRTYISTANGLDINVYTVKWLVNHKFNSADVTAGYDIPDMDRLRTASEKIEAKLLRVSGASTGTVIPLRKPLRHLGR